MTTDPAPVATVAVGTDGSPTANEAVGGLPRWHDDLDAKLVLLSAFQGSGSTSPDRDIELQWAVNSSARMNSMLERLEADMRAGGVKCEARADEGDPAEVLVRLAAGVGCRPARDRQQGDEAPRPR